MESYVPRLRTNLDTNFLKLVATAAMLVDHVGAIFFPAYPVFRWIGRISFPIFCYCMVVGLLYTRSFPRYLGRVGLFALLSQPCWALALYPNAFLWGLLGSLNIFFTLFFSLLAVWGWSRRSWGWFLLGLAASLILPCDYHAGGILWMLLFYLCRNRPAAGAAGYLLYTLWTALVGRQAGEVFTFVVNGLPIGYEIFLLGAFPFLFLHTQFHPRINKWFFYGFYPLHLLAIGLIRLALEI